MRGETTQDNAPVPPYRFVHTTRYSHFRTFARLTSLPYRLHQQRRTLLTVLENRIKHPISQRRAVVAVPWQLTRGMKVRSSVKKLCEGCKVR